MRARSIEGRDAAASPASAVSYPRRMKASLDGRSTPARARVRAVFAGVFRLGIGLCAAGGTAGCIADNEAVVFVDPSIEEPAVAVSSKALGTDLTGSFRLVLSLGPRASGPSQVTVQKLEITSADQKTSLVPSLETTSDMTFPVTVALDSEVRALFTIDLGGALLPASAAAELCGAGGLRIAGSIQDSLQSGATPVTSAVFQPSGCP